MIRIKPDILYVRDPETGKFEPVAAIKGADSVVENLSTFATSVTGDSEHLLMTQKGVTDIRNKLINELSNGDFVVNEAAKAQTATHATTANEALHADRATDADSVDTLKTELSNGDFVVSKATNADSAGYADEAGNADTATKADFASAAETAQSADRATDADHAIEASAANTLLVRDAPNDDTDLPLMVYQPTIDQYKEVYDSGITYNPNKKELSATTFVGALKGRAASATNAVTAASVSAIKATTGASGRHIWFSDTTETKRAYNDNFQYTPSTDTLKVGHVTGTAACVAPSTGEPDYTITFSNGEGSLQGTLPCGCYVAEFKPNNSNNRCGIYLKVDSGSNALIGRDVVLSRAADSEQGVEKFNATDADDQTGLSGTLKLYKFMSFPIT